MRDLSVIIPARNEIFLQNTIDDVLKNRRLDTEIIVILDGCLPHIPIPQNERVTVMMYPESIGQRAGTNQGVKISTAKYIMKLDAHCSVDEGFDEKLIADMQPDWTMIPRMYNLHAFDWRCKKCAKQTYQGPIPTQCGECQGSEFESVLVWKAKPNPCTDFTRFDRELHFQYWREFKKRPEAQGDIAETMSNLGACWLMERKRYWELGGLDEAHGSWGQMGTEISCKTWLSGGRQVVNKKTWFAHMFRTQGGFSFPYQISGEAQNKAKEYSKRLWLGNNWPNAKHDLSWLIDRFSPVPDWHE